jgi:hypothetical protein
MMKKRAEPDTLLFLGKGVNEGKKREAPESPPGPLQNAFIPRDS